MKMLGRKVTATAGALLLAASFAPTASAAPPAADTYAAEADASALLVNLFGQQLTVGAANTTVTSPDLATAKGSGALLVSQEFGGSEAAATGAGAADGSATPSCSPLTLPESVPLLDLSAACSSAIAAVTDAGGDATATGQALHLSLGGDPLVQPILDQLPIPVITEALLSGLGGLLDTVLPVPTEEVVDELNTLLNDALTGNGVSLLTVDAGGSESRSTSTADAVSASSVAKGAVIKVVDRGGSTFGLQPVLTIEAGTSTTKVTRDRSSGETTAEETAVPLRITVADDIAFLLQLPENTIEVPEGQQVDLPLPAPLTSSIKLSGGSTKELGDGASAESGTVELNLLQGVNGGVRVALSTGSASVVGTKAPTGPTTPPQGPTTTVARPGGPPAATPPPAPRTTLPRTGINDDRRQELMIGLLLSAGALGALVVRSSRRSRSARA